MQYDVLLRLDHAMISDRRAWVAATLAITLPLFLSEPVGTSANERTPRTTAQDSWIPPATLLAPGMGFAYVTDYSLAASPVGTFVAGLRGKIPEPAVGTPRRDTIVVIRIPPAGGQAEVLSAPAYLGNAVSPTIGVTRDGVVHLLWGSSDTLNRVPAASAATATARVLSLWHAQFADGEWTRPRRIIAAMSLAWRERQAGSLVRGPSGELHISVGARAQRGSVRMFHIRIDSTVQISPARTSPVIVGYTATLVDPLGRLTVAAIGAGPAVNVPGSLGNRVFSMNSSDAAVWSAPTLLTDSIAPRAYYVRGAVASDGRRYLVWRSGRIGDPWWLALAISSSSRSEWTLHSFPMGATSWPAPEIAADSCGRLYASVEDSVGSLLFGQIDSTGVRRISGPFNSGRSVSGLRLSSAPDGVHAVWTVHGTADSLPRMEYSRYAGHCD